MTDRTAFRSCVLAFALDRAPRPLDLIVVSALFFLFGGGLWVVSGHEFSRWTETPLLCSWSAMWAVAVDIIFKHIFD
jgi:hypothetical protein